LTTELWEIFAKYFLMGVWVLKKSGIVCASFGVEGRGTPVVDSGGWGVGRRRENFTYAPTISYNIIMRCNSAELNKKGTQYDRTY
jgi:hypothetical protein